MNDKGLYRKIGRKYIPASDDETIGYLRDGFYLLQKSPYSTRVSPVNPAKAAVAAAMRTASLPMINAMTEAYESRPQPRNGSILSPREKKAYAAYEKIMGKGAPAGWSRAAFQDVVEAGLMALEGHIEKKIPPPF